MALRCLRNLLLFATLSNNLALATNSQEDDTDEDFYDSLYMPLFFLLGSTTLYDMTNLFIPTFELFDTTAIAREVSLELFENF